MMKKFYTISIVLTMFFMSACSMPKEETANNEADTAAYSVIDEISSDEENLEIVSAVELAVQAADIIRNKIFPGCTVGIMKGGEDEEYVKELAQELAQRIYTIGYTVNLDGEYSENADVSFLYTDGDYEDAIALITREDIVMIVCCDMDSTEKLLSSDNVYQCIGETIAAVGMNDEECKRIEHR